MLFEHIGMVTTGVSYMHVHMAFNISTLREPLQHFADSVKHLGQASSKLQAPEAKKLLEYTYYDLSQSKIALEQDYEDILSLMEQQNEAIVAPERHKRFLTGLMAGFGMLGTFMSLYNRYEIGVLQSAVSDLQQQQQHMVDILQDHESRIATVEKDVKILGEMCRMMNVALSSLSEVQAIQNAAARLDRAHTTLRAAVDVVQDLFQQAFHRKVSLKMVRVNQLTSLLRRLTRRARNKGYQLLITDPLHLMQSETSFIYSKDVFTMIIHVPMVRKHGLLKLYQFIKFPLVYDESDKDSTVLFFSPEETLIGVGSHHEYHKALTLADLGQCEKIGRTFICRYHSILHKNASDTCIGAIFFNKVDVAHQICPVLIHMGQEVVHQLSEDRFEVFSPVAQQVHVQCGDGSSNRINLAPGIKQLELKGDCQGESRHHLFYSDFEMTASERFKPMIFPLDLAKITLNLPKEVIINASQMFQDLGKTPHNVKDLRKLYDFHTRTPVWAGHYWSWGGLLILSCLFLGALIAGCVLVMKRRQVMAKGGEFLRQASKRWTGGRHSAPAAAAVAAAEFELKRLNNSPSAPTDL